MNNCNIDQIKKQVRRYLQDINNIYITLCEHQFYLHYDKLKEDISELEINYVCEKITYNKFEDKIIFTCIFVGKHNVLHFEYYDGWICTVTHNDNKSCIISECENINKFCSELIDTISV